MRVPPVIAPRLLLYHSWGGGEVVEWELERVSAQINAETQISPRDPRLHQEGYLCEAPAPSQDWSSGSASLLLVQKTGRMTICNKRAPSIMALLLRCASMSSDLGSWRLNTCSLERTTEHRRRGVVLELIYLQLRGGPVKVAVARSGRCLGEISGRVVREKFQSHICHAEHLS